MEWSLLPFITHPSTVHTATCSVAMVSSVLVLCTSQTFLSQFSGHKIYTVSTLLGASGKEAHGRLPEYNFILPNHCSFTVGVCSLYRKYIYLNTHRLFIRGIKVTNCGRENRDSVSNTYRYYYMRKTTVAILVLYIIVTKELECDAD